jgi:hypothetical protein
MQPDDDAEVDARRDEDLRRQRWDVFIEVILNFAETEGFSGVLAAVTRALRDREEGKA